MIDRIKKKRIMRLRRHQRVRKSISGKKDHPRLNVFRSNQHIYAQIIDDSAGHTLVAASDFELKNEMAKNKLTKSAIAQKVGNLIAQKAIKKGIKKVVFDRGGYRYFGRVKYLSEGAREKGLEF